MEQQINVRMFNLIDPPFQIDLRFEAENIERFKENFRDVDFVKFPTPLRPFVTRTILVETFEVSYYHIISVGRKPHMSKTVTLQDPNSNMCISLHTMFRVC